MKYLIAFAHFWYDFIVGDDWTIAVAVVSALVLTAALVRADIPAWWLLPTIVLAFLGFSVLRVARQK
jgi:hypothetical protein